MTHLHHIIPRHMGGTDDPSNLYECTVEEHAELHFALYLEYGRYEDWVAAQGLAGMIDNAEWIKMRQSIGGSKSQFVSEETKAKISASHIGKPKHTAESKSKLSKYWTGRKRSEEFGKICSASRLGKKRGHYKKRAQ